MTTGLEPSTLFIVDDNPGDRVLVRRMLDDFAPARFRMEEAWNLADALTRLRTGGIDLLVLDLNLPDSRGVASLNKVQGIAPNLPVIVVTGIDDKQMVADVLGSTGHRYFVKGHFDAQMLGLAVDQCLSTRRGIAGT